MKEPNPEAVCLRSDRHRQNSSNRNTTPPYGSLYPFYSSLYPFLNSAGKALPLMRYTREGRPYTLPGLVGTMIPKTSLRTTFPSCLSSFFLAPADPAQFRISLCCFSDFSSFHSCCLTSRSTNSFF